MTKILEEFKKLYGELIDCVPNTLKDELSIFYHEVGKKYFNAEDKILFIGKSVNSWLNGSLNVNELFDENNDGRIINRDDQIQWIENNVQAQYNTNKSAFLRFMKNFSLEYFKEGDWYNYIAWSNLYKLSPAIGGNPNPFLCNIQYKLCIEIINKEIEYLNPKYIIFLTSLWESFYLESIGFDTDKNKILKWDIYETQYQEYKNKIFIQSKHPQSKKEIPHIEAVIKIINLFK